MDEKPRASGPGLVFWVWVVVFTAFIVMTVLVTIGVP